MATGTVTLDFGAFPGKADTSVTVTGQTAIAVGSLVEAWIRPDELEAPGHTADEHMVEGLKVFAGSIVAGTGFTVYGVEASPVTARNEGHLLYGEFTVAWAWV
jgi:hypothetical protein